MSFLTALGGKQRKDKDSEASWMHVSGEKDVTRKWE